MKDCFTGSGIEIPQDPDQTTQDQIVSPENVEKMANIKKAAEEVAEEQGATPENPKVDKINKILKATPNDGTGDYYDVYVASDGVNEVLGVSAEHALARLKDGCVDRRYPILSELQEDCSLRRGRREENEKTIFDKITGKK